MKTMGFVLLVAGVVALAYGGISYSRQRTIIDMGPIKATATEQHNVPLSPIVGSIAIVGGLLLLISKRRRPA